MEPKTATVRAAIARCDAWYAARARDIRTLTEPINACWIEVEHHVRRMELAEASGLEESASFHFQRVLEYLTRIYAQAQEARG